MALSVLHPVSTLTRRGAGAMSASVLNSVLLAKPFSGNFALLDCTFRNKNMLDSQYIEL